MRAIGSGATLALQLTLGAAAGSLVPLMATIRQERSPAHMLARVVGLSTASVPVTGPMGVLTTGVLIDEIGLPRTLLFMTAAALRVCAAAWASRAAHLFDRPAVPQVAVEPLTPVDASPA